MYTCLVLYLQVSMCKSNETEVTIVQKPLELIFDQQKEARYIYTL